MPDATALITGGAAGQIRAAIAEARGAEVFFAGRLDASGSVAEVLVLARGNDEAVPALLDEALRFDVVLHNHPSGELKPSEPDIAIASRLAAGGGVGFYIVDQTVSEVYVVVEPSRRRRAGKLDPGELARLLHPSGALARLLPGYERRPEQAEMLRRVAEAFNRDGILLVEAGTGTGKSLAYLVPAMLWAEATGERCVVSTGTINLQQQLIGKDIPFVARALDLALRAVLVKGRGNYLCLMRLSALQGDMAPLLDDKENVELRLLIAWAARTEDGSLADLNFRPAADLWDKIQSDGDTCLHLRCPHLARCYFNRARKTAAAADLLVVNHHLLFADLAIKSHGAGIGAGVLPPYTRVILDEAHNVEDAASSFFGLSFSRNGLLRLLRRLHHPSRAAGGLVPLIAHRARSVRGGGEISGAAEEALPALAALPEEIDAAFQGLMGFLGARGQNADGELKLRVRPEIEEDEEWERAIRTPMLELAGRLQAAQTGLSELEEALDDLEGEDLLVEGVQLHALRNRLTDRIATVRQLVGRASQEGEVRWLQGRPGWRRVMSLESAPLEVGPILRQALYDAFPTVVLTSATLTAAGSFDYVRQRLGIPDEGERPVDELALSSSFDFRRQALVAVPTDMPEPSAPEFATALAERILAMLRVSGGRAFVLFTAYGLMDKLYRELAPALQEMGVAALRQGQDDRHRLLERFKQDETSVLFGTDSFWQGVDAPGRTLECVILTRLPFRVPTEPLIEARVEAIDRAGGNSFYRYTIPQAIIRFKQGFGRLIRTRQDRGVVAVLDKRLVEKAYGRAFLSSLPDCERAIGPTVQVLERMKEFLAAGA